MVIEFRCSKCQTLLRTPDDTAGRPAVCPKCGSGLQVPYVSAPAERDTSVRPEVRESQSAAPPTPTEQMAITSMILGIVSLCFSCCCLITLPAAIAGIVTGVKGLPSRRRGMAVAGIIMSAIALVISLVATVVLMLADVDLSQGFP